VNIVDLGLVYDCQLTKRAERNQVDVKMTLTLPACGMGPAIAHDAQSKILTIDGVDEADVQLVWDRHGTRAYQRSRPDEARHGLNFFSHALQGDLSRTSLVVSSSRPA